MKIIVVKENEAGQRMDKLLMKYLNKAPSSFIFKMLRKKNIVLNEKKADGREMLKAGDEIRIFLSDETYEKFSEEKHLPTIKKAFSLDIVYEDDNLLLINKPAGVLSQKAEPSDISINEYCLNYLAKSGAVTAESLKSFTPAVCNRLDRNTSGLIICAKTLQGAQQLSKALKERTMHKYYQCLVAADIRETQHLKGYLSKNEKTNKVSIQTERSTDALDLSEIETRYHPLAHYGRLTLLEVELLTGKPHQIRAHLASVKAPIIGDHKYGNQKINEYYKEHFGVKSQLLHAYKLEMPEFEGALANLSGKTFQIELPEIFKKIIGEKNGDMEQQGS